MTGAGESRQAGGDEAAMSGDEGRVGRAPGLDEETSRAGELGRDEEPGRRDEQGQHREQGLQGEHGRQGTPGQHGEPGRPGEPSPDGDPGPDGDPSRQDEPGRGGLSRQDEPGRPGGVRRDEEPVPRPADLARRALRAAREQRERVSEGNTGQVGASYDGPDASDTHAEGPDVSDGDGPQARPAAPSPPTRTGTDPAPHRNPHRACSASRPAHGGRVPRTPPGKRCVPRSGRGGAPRRRKPTGQPRARLDRDAPHPPAPRVDGPRPAAPRTGVPLRCAAGSRVPSRCRQTRTTRGPARCRIRLHSGGTPR